MQRQWRSPWSPPVGPTSSWQCKTESCAPPGWQSRLCFCPGHSPLYPLPNARLPHGCIPTCPSCGSTFPYCISLAFLSLRGSFPCGAVLSDCHLPGISRRSTGRWYASLAASAHKGYRRSAPATRSPAAFPLCSRALPVNGTSRGGSRNGAADTSSALCAGSRSECHTCGCSSAVSPATQYSRFSRSAERSLDSSTHPHNISVYNCLICTIKGMFFNLLGKMQMRKIVFCYY